MSGQKASVLLAVTTALSVLGALSAAAGQHESGRDKGGFVVEGSTAGVNPAYHPEYFGSPANYACFERFKTYDAASATYLGNDGRRHPCRR